MPSSYQALGFELARFRVALPVPQRTVAARSGTSKSSLHRYENGARLPLNVARSLDEIYGTDGWIVSAVAHLEFPTWRWSRSRADTFFVHRWPAGHDGWVWIKVSPGPKAINAPHRLHLRWGPWRREVVNPVAEEGLVLRTGKAGEDVAVECQLSADKPVTVLFGIDRPSGPGEAMDIRNGWFRESGEALT
jgi:hypothetical protein